MSLVGRNISEQPDASQVRSETIQKLVKSKEEKDLQELIEFLKYRRISLSQKRKQVTRESLNLQEKDDLAIPADDDAPTKLVKDDLETAISYLKLTATDPLLDLYSSKLNLLYKQIMVDKDEAKIAVEDMPTLTEFIYRAVYHAKVQCGQEDPNPINDKRGAELVARISKNPKLQMLGGVFILVMGFGLAVGGVASLILTFGLSAPVSGPLTAVGLFGMSGGGYNFNKGRKALSTQTLAAKTVTDKKSEKSAKFTLSAFFKPDNRTSITIPVNNDENASLVSSEISPVYHRRHVNHKKKNGYIDWQEEGSFSMNFQTSEGDLPGFIDSPRSGKM